MARGRRHGRGLADMSPDPPDDRYSPPRKDLCDVNNWPVVIGEATIQNAVWIYNKRVVHFSIETWLDEDQLTRVDTTHGTLHRHTFWRSGADDVTVIDAIPLANGRAFVDNQFQKYVVNEPAQADNEIQRWRSQ